MTKKRTSALMIGVLVAFGISQYMRLERMERTKAQRHDRMMQGMKQHESAVKQTQSTQAQFLALCTQHKAEVICTCTLDAAKKSATSNEQIGAVVRALLDVTTSGTWPPAPGPIADALQACSSSLPPG